MRKQLLLNRLALLLVLLFYCSAMSQWTNLNTGINDNLTGAVFLGSNGLVSGNGGIYFTTNGGSGAGSWTRFQITDNATNSTIYENTSFTHCYSDSDNTSNSGFVYACGRDNSTTKAVIFKLAIPAMTYEIIYQGPANSKLNKIDCYSGTYLAVGDDGLLVIFTGSQLNVIPTGWTEDLLSIDLLSNKALIGSATKLYWIGYSNTVINNLGERANEEGDHKDVLFTGNSDTYSLASDGVTYSYIGTGFPSTIVNQNFYAPLNGNGLTYFSNRFFVASDHGIYRSSFTPTFANTAFEWQPTSGNVPVRDFWSQLGNTAFYAYGNNGVILKTTNSGGSSKPYVKITSNGGCLPGAIYMNALTGSGNAWSWYVNEVLVQSGTASFSYSFPGAGAYNVALTVTNSFGEQSTDTKTIYAVNPPQVDKNLTVNNDILCKQGTVSIQIADSEPNVYYMLKKEGDAASNFGESAAANGGVVTLNSGTIDLSGDYYIHAYSSLANCNQRFTGNFHITVEETSANFHAGLINAQVNEPVVFNENSVDAQHFEWQFSAGASVATATSANPTVAFNASGQASATLHAWSDHNCDDTVTDSQPYIFQPPSQQDGCFLLTNDSTDPTWPGHYNPDISQMVPTADGFLICGTYYNEIFDSKHGVVKSMPGKKGGYLAKYDRNGVVRWIVYNINTEFGNNNGDVIFSTAVDAYGNIYLSGKGTGNFIDNTGGALNLSATLNEPKYYLMKLNPQGERIWCLQNSYLAMLKIAVDKENNIVALGSLNGFSPTQLYFNGQLGETIGEQNLPDATYAMLKFSSAGAVIWDTKVEMSSANVRKFAGIGFDNGNNMYVAMCFDGFGKVYEPGTLNEQTINGDGNYGSKIGLFKFNANGIVQWKLRSRTTNTLDIQNDSTEAFGMIVEDDGTVYMTGQNSTSYNLFGNIAFTHYFENTDGTSTAATSGPFFTAKISSNGVCQWLRTSGQTYYGYGWNLLKSENEIYVVGQMQNNNTESCSGTFDSADGNGYNLTINRYDYFVSVYSESGNLNRLFVNNEGGNAAYMEGVTGFFKGNSDDFYMAKNLSPMNGGELFNDFGQSGAPLNGTDGTIIHFTDACGIMKYSNSLQVANLNNTGFKVAPNPTSGRFSVQLNALYPQVLLKIYDISGKLVSSRKFDSVSTLDAVIDAEAGLYFGKVETGGSVQWIRIVKK